MIPSVNLHVSWKPVNPQDCVWKNLYRNIMRTLSQEKGTIHCNITNWYTNLDLCLKHWWYPQQKQQWIKNGKNLKRFRRGTTQKSETNLTWLMKQEKVEKYTSHHWWTSVIRKMPNWRRNTKNTKVSRTPRWYCKRRFRILCSIHWTRIIRITNDGSKGHGYHIQTCQDAQDNQLTQYLLIPR